MSGEKTKATEQETLIQQITKTMSPNSLRTCLLSLASSAEDWNKKSSDSNNGGSTENSGTNAATASGPNIPSTSGTNGASGDAIPLQEALQNDTTKKDDDDSITVVKEKIDPKTLQERERKKRAKMTELEEPANKISKSVSRFSFTFSHFFTFSES